MLENVLEERQLLHEPHDVLALHPVVLPIHTQPIDDIGDAGRFVILAAVLGLGKGHI